MTHRRLSRSGVCGVVAALAICALWLSSCSDESASTGSEPSQPPGGGHLTPLLDRVLSPPHWFTGTDGQAHLAYELLLTNILPVPVTVSAVEVRDVDSGATLIRLAGDSLLAAMSLVASPVTPSVLLPPAAVGVVWLDIPLAGQSAIPAALTHRLTIDPPPGVPIGALGLSYTGEAVAVDRRPPIVLGAPLAGRGWAALGSCCDGPHRRAPYPIDGRWYLAQRFAIDFNQLDSENRPGTGDPTLPTSFPTFGQPALAVADATVVDAVDRQPDLKVGEPREDPTPDTPPAATGLCWTSVTGASPFTRTCERAAWPRNKATESPAGNTSPRSEALAPQEGLTSTSR